MSQFGKGPLARNGIVDLQRLQPVLYSKAFFGD